MRNDPRIEKNGFTQSALGQAVSEVDRLRAELATVTKERDQAWRLVEGMKREAREYVTGSMKCVNWLCDHGFQDDTGNPTETVLKKLDEAQRHAAALQDALCAIERAVGFTPEDEPLSTWVERVVQERDQALRLIENIKRRDYDRR